MEEDLRISYKNIEHIREALIKLDETSREDLSALTKDLGNQIIGMYENLETYINDQRCENLRLQLEIETLNKEKNTLRFEIKNMITAVRKLENFMGVEPDPKFDNLIGNNPYKN
jgi:hypothetical protein